MPFDIEFHSRETRLAYKTHHALESFLWVILWVAIHHTAHSYPLVYAALTLKVQLMLAARCVETQWGPVAPYRLQRCAGDAFITWLLDEYGRLLKRDSDDGGGVLSYDAVLEMTDAWPTVSDRILREPPVDGPPPVAAVSVGPESAAGADLSRKRRE